MTYQHGLVRRTAARHDQKMRLGKELGSRKNAGIEVQGQSVNKLLYKAVVLANNVCSLVYNRD